MDLILAIDQGTHASRALVLDGDGRIVAQSLRTVDLSRPRAGHAEQDGEQIIATVQDCIDDVLAGLPAAQRRALRCAGITTQRSTVLAWRPDGSSASPAVNWQDTRGAAMIDALRAREADIRRLSGLPLSAHYGASKLHWLQRSLADPQRLHFGPLAAFLTYRLTAGAVNAVDHSNAQRMQLFDIHRLDWSAQLCDWFEVDAARLPQCRAVYGDYGSLQPHGIALTAVCGDQNAAWFASSEPPPGTARVNLGSGAFVLARQPGPDGEGELLSSIAYSEDDHCDYLIEGTVNGSGNALQWLADNFSIGDLKQNLGHWLDAVRDPPLFLNTVGGLGSPWWRQGLEPVFVGADTSSGEQRAVAVAESILFLVQYNLQRIQRRQPVDTLRVSGGLSRVDALCRKLADLSGLPVEQVNESEASARGIAWLAAGRPRTWLASDSRRFEPRADAALKTRYDSFIEQLKKYIEDNTHAPSADS